MQLQLGSIYIKQSSLSLCLLVLFLKYIHHINTVGWKCSENCICSCKWHTHLSAHTHIARLGGFPHSQIGLCLKKPQNVSSGFLISDYSIGPCEAYSTVFSRQSSLEIDIACVYCPDRTLLPLECHFLGHWTLVDFGLQQTYLVSTGSTGSSSKHFLCLL